MRASQKLGNEGEDRAVEHLRRNGYRIVARNYRNRLGEIDIIAEEKGMLVFVEVKALSGSEGFSPTDHFNGAKRRKLLRLGQAYLARLRESRDARFDLVTLVRKGSDWAIDHLEDVLQDTAP